MRIYLTGFMGSGKTTVGRKLAERLTVPFVDLDHENERRTHKSVREIFAGEGEALFRRLEAEALRATQAYPDVVVATGGGTVAFAGNLNLIRQAGISVWLNPAFQTLVDRIGAAGKRDRPLFRGDQASLYRDGCPFHRTADVTVDGSGESAEEVAARWRYG
jgi:shikimate kinase